MKIGKKKCQKNLKLFLNYGEKIMIGYIFGFVIVSIILFSIIVFTWEDLEENK